VTLHDELADILRARGNAWMTTSELANAVNDRGRYRKNDSSPVTAFQVHGRARQYAMLFERDGSRIRLSAAPVATPSANKRRYLIHQWRREQWEYERANRLRGDRLTRSASNAVEYSKLRPGTGYTSSLNPGEGYSCLAAWMSKA
jgi:hypothetical protein